MILKLIGKKTIYAAALFATLFNTANANTDLECPQYLNYTKYSEIKFKDSAICIISNNELAKLILINNKHPESRIENSTLIEPSEVQEKTVHLEHIGDQANLYFEHSKNTYLIAIDVRNRKLLYATHTMKVPGLKEDLADSELTLRTENSTLNSANLKDITKDSLFNKNKLTISSETKLKITSPKAYLLDSPTAPSPTKMYLIKGDEVSATEYKDGKLKIRYTTSKGKIIEKWINISSVL